MIGKLIGIMIGIIIEIMTDEEVDRERHLVDDQIMIEEIIQKKIQMLD